MDDRQLSDPHVYGTTVQAVEARRLQVHAVYLNNLGGHDESMASNLLDLRRLLDVPVQPFAYDASLG